MKLVILTFLAVSGVILLATGLVAAGSDSTTLTLSGTVITEGAPVADFFGTPLVGPTPLTVQFTDLSTGSPEEWEWDFESDGVIDAYISGPLFHVYTNPGTYTVSLTIRNDEGSDTEVKSGYITVQEPDPSLRILALKEYIQDLPIQFWTKWFLTMSLDRALDQLEKGHERPAINQLDLFLQTVDLMERARFISRSQAAYMREEANAIVDLIMA
jgi:PKD repeat protein